MIPAAPRILYVVDGARGHITQHVRGFQYKAYLEKAGWQIRFLDAAREGEAAIVDAARDADVVYLLKAGTPALLRRLRKNTAAVTIFDLTDALWKPFHRLRGWHDLDRLLRSVDAVFAENEVLCAYARHFNDCVEILPACVPMERFDSLRHTAPLLESSAIIVGWVGSRTTVGALQKVRNVLAALAGRHPHLEVRVVGADPVDVARILRGIPHTVLANYDEESMIREMLAFDIGIFPVPLDDEDYRVRGPLKALLYMAAGLPVVCQGGGEGARIFRDGTTAMLADSDAAWESKLEALILSPLLRRQMGAAALKEVRAHHSLMASSQVLLQAMNRARARARADSSHHPVSLLSSLQEWVRSRVFRLEGLVFK